MNRSRWSMGLLGAFATVLALRPATTLFRSDDWLAPAVGVVGFVALAGAALRAGVRSKPAVVVVQLVATAYVILLRFGPDTFSYLLPTAQTFELARTFGLMALETIQGNSAPAPLTAGVTFCLVTAAGLVAIAVDATAATWRSPAAAGLPLLTAYLVAATNGTGSLPPMHFVAPVLVWLAMVHVTARRRFSRWGTSTARDLDAVEEGSGRGALRSFSSVGVRLGLVGIVAAVVLPNFVPHSGVRYLGGGLGTSPAEGDVGQVGFSSTIDLRRSLESTDKSPVLRYTTTGPERLLRVVATTYLSNGEWSAVDSGQYRSGRARPLPRSRTVYTMSVTFNRLGPREVAAPHPVVGLGPPAGRRLSIDPASGDVKVGRPISRYDVTYAPLPSAAELRAVGERSTPDPLGGDLHLPYSATELVKTWADDVTGDATNNYDKAVAIQNHLRDSTLYTHTLNLAGWGRNEAGRIVEPVRAFYEARSGYCAHFATAMILMARAEGIPARMVMGYLPGRREEGEVVVRQSDAHAWAELYFEGYGWLPFDPTPASRSGRAPYYAEEVAGAGATETSADGPTSTRSAAPRRPEPESGGDSASGDSTWLATTFTTRTVVTSAAVLMGLLATLLMPLSAGFVGLRRRRAARDRQDLIEVEWDELTSHLHDLGLDPPPGGTLRQWRQHFITSGHLDHDNAEAMGRVTATLERARYARPERTSPEQAAALHRDIRSIRRQVSRTRALGTRARSFLWPSTGVAFWRRVLGSPRLRRRTDHGRSIKRPSSRRDPGGAGPVARDGVGRRIAD